jgi:hypothetical protein
MEELRTSEMRELGYEEIITNLNDSEVHPNELEI